MEPKVISMYRADFGDRPGVKMVEPSVKYGELHTYLLLAKLSIDIERYILDRPHARAIVENIGTDEKPELIVHEDIAKYNTECVLLCYPSQVIPPSAPMCICFYRDKWWNCNAFTHTTIDMVLERKAEEKCRTTP